MSDLPAFRCTAYKNMSVLGSLHRRGLTRIRCVCGGKGYGSVHGTGPYDDDSHLCKAAQHQGVISSEGGTFVVGPSANKSVVGLKFPVDIHPGNYVPTKGLVEYPEPSGREGCLPCSVYSHGMDGAFFCDDKCNKTAKLVVNPMSSVYGSGPYYATDRHRLGVCLAAKHAGIIPPTGGGAFRVALAAGQKFYPKSTTSIETEKFHHGTLSFTVHPMDESPVRMPYDVTPAARPCMDYGWGLDGYFRCPGVTECKEMHRAVYGSGPVYGADSSACAAALHAGAIPPSGGVFRVALADATQRRTDGSTQNGVTSLAMRGFSEALGICVSPVDVALAAKIGVYVEAATPCEVVSLSSHSADLVGGLFKCNGDCLRGRKTFKVNGGPEAYTIDSNICAAAVHSGVIPITGGTFFVLVQSGRDKFKGSKANGISSNSWNHPDTKSFIILPQRPPDHEVPVPCSKFAYSSIGGLVTCDGHCSQKTGSVVLGGTEGYGVGSDVCQAAMHAGVIPLSGGTFRIRMKPGRPSSEGSFAHGVYSRSSSITVGFQVYYPDGSYPEPYKGEQPVSCCSDTLMKTSGLVWCEGLTDEDRRDVEIIVKKETEGFTVDSHLCAVAVDTNIIPSTGGLFRILMSKDGKHFTLEKEFFVDSCWLRS
eukprot:PhF_6_TR2272/c0_g1_i2/m.3933